MALITLAFLPAAISYVALIYIVHLEAVKRNMPTIGDRVVSMGKTIGGMFAFFAGFALLCYATQFPVALVTSLVPEGAGWILAAMVGVVYLLLVWFASKSPDLELDDPNAKDVTLPVVSEIYKTGLYYLLPIIVLVYFLMIEQKSPALSAFWATMLLFLTLVTQRPLKAFFRGETNFSEQFMSGVVDLRDGLVAGARNMIGIGLATATAGVIVGTVTLTGVGQVMADLVEFLSGGNLILMLILVGFLSLFLGMGLPTTANYIVVSSLLAAVVVELGAQADLIVPLIAVHLFVFYFGIMADVTPPVGLASFAAAAVSGGDAIKTGFTAFFYSLRTVALPFVFIFNTDLLLIDVGLVKGIFVFIVASIAILVFTAGTMGWFITRNKVYESVALVLIAFVLFRPDFVINRVQPPYQSFSGTELAQSVGTANVGDELRVVVSGPDFDNGQIKQLTLLLDIANEGSGEERLSSFGLATLDEDGKVLLEEPFPGTPFFDQMSGFDFYGDESVVVAEIKTPSDQLPKEIVFFPAFLALAFLMFLQFRRSKNTKEEKLA